MGKDNFVTIEGLMIARLEELADIRDSLNKETIVTGDEFEVGAGFAKDLATEHSINSEVEAERAKAVASVKLKEAERRAREASQARAKVQTKKYQTTKNLRLLKEVSKVFLPKIMPVFDVVSDEVRMLSRYSSVNALTFTPEDRFFQFEGFDERTARFAKFVLANTVWPKILVDNTSKTVVRDRNGYSHNERVGGSVIVRHPFFVIGHKKAGMGLRHLIGLSPYCLNGYEPKPRVYSANDNYSAESVASDGLVSLMSVGGLALRRFEAHRQSLQLSPEVIRSIYNPATNLTTINHHNKFVITGPSEKGTDYSRRIGNSTYDNNVRNIGSTDLDDLSFMEYKTPIFLARMAVELGVEAQMAEMLKAPY